MVSKLLTPQLKKHSGPSQLSKDKQELLTRDLTASASYPYLQRDLLYAQGPFSLGVGEGYPPSPMHDVGLLAKNGRRQIKWQGRLLHVTQLSQHLVLLPITLSLPINSQLLSQVTFRNVLLPSSCGVAMNLTISDIDASNFFRHLLAGSVIERSNPLRMSSF